MVDCLPVIQATAQKHWKVNCFTCAGYPSISLKIIGPTNSNSNRHDNVYFLFLQIKWWWWWWWWWWWCCHPSTAIAGVHPVHLWMQNSTSTFGPSRMAWAADCLMTAIVFTCTIAIYYYSAPKLILILPSHGGQKAESTWVVGYTQMLYLNADSHPSK